MKKDFGIFRKVRYAALVMFILLYSVSCKPEADTPPDPQGTVTININTTVNATPVILYSGPIEQNDYWIMNNTDTVFFSNVNVNVLLGVDNNINFQILHHYGDNNNWGWFQWGGEFADIGKMDGLGNVKEIPQSGWSKTIAAEKGHGYALRYKHSLNLNDEQYPMYYAIFYVEDYLISSVNGGKIGIVLKIKNPYQ